MNKLVGLVDLYAPRSSPGVAREKRRARQLTVTRSLPALASEHAEPLAGRCSTPADRVGPCGCDEPSGRATKLAHEQLAAERLEAAVAKRAAQQQRRPLSACGKTRSNWPTPIARADRRLARHMSAQRVALRRE